MIKSESGSNTTRKRGKPKGTKNGYTITEKALAQRREATVWKNSNKPFEGEEKQYNAQQIEHILRIHEIATQADRKDPASLKSCFINYLLLCEKDGFKIGNMGAYASMGINAMTIERWLKSDRQEYKELAEFVKLTCSLAREGLIADQKINPVIGIFWQRNYDGLRNDTEQQQNLSEENATETETTGDYMKKYGKLIDE